MLRAIERFFVTWRFATFAIVLLCVFATLLGALLWIPPAPSGLGAFAEDFRVWCFGAESTSRDAGGLMRFAVFFEVLSMAGLIGLIWLRQLRDQLKVAPREMLPWALTAVAVVVLMGASLWLLGKPADDSSIFPARELRLSQPAPALELVDQKGETVSLESLKGQVVLVTAVYATCGLACPRILGQAKRVVSALEPAERGGVTVLGITLDPNHDTPEVLTSMAAAQRITVPQYHLLTGTPETVNRALDAFQVERKRNPTTGIIDHSNLFVLIDRRGTLAYRFTLGELQEKWMIQAVRTLLAEPPLAPSASRD